MTNRIDIGGGRVWTQVGGRWVEVPTEDGEVVLCRGGARSLDDAEIERAERGLGPEAIPPDAQAPAGRAPNPSACAAYTSEQLAAAVYEAHAALHRWETQAGPGHPLHAEVTRAHEALHRVGAGALDEHAAKPQMVASTAPELTPYRQQRADAGHCMANNDGECSWSGCPQLKDHKPTCPRWAAMSYDEDR